jgi:RecG-like helicase
MGFNPRAQGIPADSRDEPLSAAEGDLMPRQLTATATPFVTPRTLDWCIFGALIAAFLNLPAAPQDLGLCAAS